MPGLPRECRLARNPARDCAPAMKLHLENLPASLPDQRDTITRCLEKLNEAMPLQQVHFFGSHARGEARNRQNPRTCRPRIVRVFPYACPVIFCAAIMLSLRPCGMLAA